MSVEFNPARLADPTGWGLCPVELVPGTIERVVNELRPHMLQVASPPKGMESRKLKHMTGLAGNTPKIARLDLARNFNISEPNWKIELLESLVPKYSKEVKIFSNKGQKNTLQYGKRYRVHTSLYDKHEESKVKRKTGDTVEMNLVPKGVFRFETQIYALELKEMGINSSKDICPKKLTPWFINRFDLSSCGTPVYLMHVNKTATLDTPNIEAIFDAPNLSFHQKIETAGYTWAQTHDCLKHARRRDLAAMNKHLAKHGLHDKSHHAPCMQRKVKLDLITGTLVNADG